MVPEFAFESLKFILGKEKASEKQETIALAIGN